MSKEKFIKKAKSIYGEKYDFTESNYVNCKIPIKIKCIEHGYFTKTPDKFINRKDECSICIKSILNKEKYKKLVDILCLKHNNLYDYDNDYNYINYESNKSKIRVLCSLCKEYFLQQAGIHLAGSGCSNCNRPSKKYSNQKWIEKATLKHSDTYDYSKVEYKNATTNVIIICINNLKV